MDNDVVLYQDISHLLSTSYQFVMRWWVKVAACCMLLLG
jgi:hypothetical protein